MSETATREKALALVEALTGYEELDYEGGRRNKSPHAYTHLDAVLGWTPTVQTFIDAEERSYGNPEYQREMATKRDDFLDYLQGCVDALRPVGYPTRQVLLDLLAEYVSRDEAANRVADGPPDSARMGELSERARAALGDGGKP